MPIDRLTAAEFLENSYKAAGNSESRTGFKQALKELSRSPAVKQRLAFELLAMVPGLIASRQDPSEAILWGVRWRRALEPAKVPDYLALLEQAIIAYFAAIRTLPVGVGIHPWVMPLGLGLAAISDMDAPRYAHVLTALEKECGDRTTDPRKYILEAAISEDSQ
jgi:hypothetical protein